VCFCSYMMYYAMCEPNFMKTLSFCVVFRGFWVFAHKSSSGDDGAARRRLSFKPVLGSVMNYLAVRCARQVTRHELGLFCCVWEFYGVVIVLLGVLCLYEC